MIIAALAGEQLRKGSAVCIVDDDESVRVSTTRLLRLEGFSAYAFSSASEYLHSGRVGDTRCLVADVRLEGMSGRELFQHLRDQGRQIPTVFITAIADDRFRAWAKNAGAIAVFGKPFDGRALVESVRKAFADNAGSPNRR